MLLSSITDDAVVSIDNPSVPFSTTHDASVGVIYDVSHQWSFAPAGTWHFRNAIVDYENKVGPWSQPLTLNLPEGWLMMGCSRNLPEHMHRMAVIWKCINDDTDDEIWLVEGLRDGYAKHSQFGGPFSFTSPAPYPFSTNNPDPYPLVMHDRGNANLPIYSSTILGGLDAPSAPMAWPCLHSLDACEVAYSFATLSGETELCPTASLAAKSPGKVGFRRLYFSQPVAMQQGVLGLYVYKNIGGTWKRQLAAPYLTGAGNDKYLYGIHDQQIILWTDHDGPAHSATPGGAWSILSPTEQAFKTNANSIIIDDASYIYNPLIEPWLPGLRNRTITAPGMSGWFIEKRSTVPATGGKTPANNHPVYWPMLVVSNDELQATAFYGMSFIDDMSRGPGSSFAVVSRDYSGGQAFKTRFFDCYFSLGIGEWPYLKEGLHIGWEAAFTAGYHTASEWLLERCSFFGNIGIRLEGTQTVNMRFNTTHLLGVPSSPIIADGVQVAFKGGLYSSRCATLIEAGWIADIYIDEGFIDQPNNGCLINYNCNQNSKIEINRLKAREFYAISRRPVGTESLRLVLRDWDYLADNNRSVVYEVSPNRLRIDLLGSESLASKLNIKQPSQSEFEYRTGIIVAPSIPTTMPIPAPSPGGT